MFLCTVYRTLSGHFVEYAAVVLKFSTIRMLVMWSQWPKIERIKFYVPCAAMKYGR